MRRAAWTRVALAASVLVVAACPKPPPDDDWRGTRRQQVAAQATLDAWFACEECVDGEFKAVLALGPLALSGLAGSLSNGASPADSLRLERQLRARHRELAAFASRTPDARFDLGRDEFVRLYRDNHRARIQARAARALGEIGGPDAERALHKALSLELRPDVERGVRAALARSAGPP